MKRLSLLFVLAALVILARPAYAAPHSVSLSWTASTDAGVGYNVYRLGGNCPTGAPTGFTKVNTACVSATTFTDSGMAPGNYCYYVTSALGGAESVPSNTVEAVILPAAPTAVQVTGSN
jgi:hypothetical protein